MFAFKLPPHVGHRKSDVEVKGSLFLCVLVDCFQNITWPSATFTQRLHTALVMIYAE